MDKIFLFLSCIFVACSVQAGGNPDQVKFPEGYTSSYTLYHSMNRAGKPQVVDLYANKAALDSVGKGDILNDAILVMEIYKAQMDEAGNLITDDDGLYAKGDLAAIAVMEKQQWGEDYPQAERAGDWGFALYAPDGTAKANDLMCASCHIPLKDQGYLFSYEALTGYQ